VAAAVPVLQLESGAPNVEIRFWELTEQTIWEVERIGLVSSGAYPEYAVMTGRLDLGLLDAIVALPEVAVVHPQYAPEYSVGAVTSQADSSIRAALARSEFGVDGTGVTIGVISDSFNDTRGGAVSGAGCGRIVNGMVNQLSGDLPAPAGLLDNGPGGGTDEGAAMAELIHDLAPGANIIFHTSEGGTSAFASGIDELRGCGADVIVDDIKYPNEPMFQDGIVAQAAQAAVDAGVPYFSSMGNYADEAIAEDYLDANPGSDDTVMGDDFTDFGGGDRFASLVVPAGASVRFLLQWNQPFSGSSGPGSAVDLNLMLFSDDDPSSTLLKSSTTFQGCSVPGRFGDPLEFISYTNGSASDETVYLAVDHDCGSEDAFFRVVAFGSGTDFESDVYDDYSTFGHAAAAGAHAVAAVDYREIDAGGSFSGGSEIDVESYSSLGGDIPFYFDEVGNPLPGAPVTRFKPDIAAPDNTNTTFFWGGYDPDGDGFPNFSGTSAAAPHAAAVAVLVLEENSALSSSQVAAVLQNSAIDIEATGRDPLSGYGLIDARDAVAAASSIDTQAPTWPGGSTLTMSAVGETTATASWSEATDNVGVTMYRVYLNGAFWGSSATTTIDLTGLSVGSDYNIRVEALDTVGNESTGGPSTSFTTADNQAPTWPGGSTVTISAVGSTTATASWSAATDNGTVASYEVYLNGASAGSTSSTSYALSGLSPGNTYTVRIEALDGAGNESTTGPSASFVTTNPLPPGGSFSDDDSNVHEPNIEAIAAAGITLGCNPPANDMYCPNKSVTRGQMAAFLARALGLTDEGGGNSFTDDDGSVFETDIAKLAAAGITLGCNPPVNDRYCPNKSVTRGQMAAFLVRALGLTDDGGGNSFADDDGSVFETDIAKLVAAGITFGCNPPVNDQYCPNKSVTRGQMASFLARALGLDPIVPPTAQAFGDGVWLVPGEVPPGTYRNSDSSQFCSWSRLSGSPGSWNVIESWLTDEIDIVTISPSDDGFESIDCGTWSSDLSPRTSSPTADFAGGSFLVGSEVGAGIWRNSDSSGSCYWERLSGFGGSISEIIDNEFSTSIQTVTIASTDLGFSSERCGTWSKIG
jgi:hypothetical protein